MTAYIPDSDGNLPRASDWDIGNIVSELRLLRDASLAARHRQGRPPKLPSRKSLTNVIEGLSAALFPNRLSSRELAKESVDFFVGHTLDTTLRELADQIHRELRFHDLEATPREKLHLQAMELTRQFSQKLPHIRQLLDQDLAAAYAGDPAAGSMDEVLACYPGITAMISHRIAHELYGLGMLLIARIIAEIAHSQTGIDIHPGAQIEGHFFIDHGTGVVIGETAIIGEHVRLYHGVTLGAKRLTANDDATLPRGHARHPIVEDHVVIYANATILGRVTIGRESVIGGNVWLTRSIPARSNISQAKLREEDFDGGSGI